MNNKILIIEDDISIQNLIKTALVSEQYHCTVASNANEGIALTISINPSLIILDLGLPDMDGVDVINKIRSWSKTPIMVLSARSNDSDKILALDSGADDYLTKPFSVDELLARIRAFIRRSSSFEIENTPVYINGSLTIDYIANCVYIDQKEIHLTPIEYQLLCYMSKNTGKVLTHQQITHKIWGTSWDTDVASLRVFMANLRKKIEVDTNQPTYIQTHVGVGYRLLKSN